MNVLRKLTVLSIILLFIGAGIVSGIQGDHESKDNKIIETIENIPNKVLMSNEIIGDRNVKYWYHVIDDIEVKNDYILLHQDTETNIILKYEKIWREVEKQFLDLKDEQFTPTDYFWKIKVIFLDKSDCKDFYTFGNSQDYPLVCWEVRHTDGTTKMYNIEGEQIGSGVQAPYKGFSLSGYHEPGYEDPWLQWRLNADGWFTNWCDSTFSMSLPTPSIITSYISDPEYELFYELAHGGHYYFQADYTGSYYYASDVTNALSGRNPMRFAFIGSCGGMDDTGPGTWSYEFRKGEIIDTVVVGYTGMATCPGWSVSIPWQDDMFYAIDAGYTIKDAFDIASANWPTIAPCVVFTGDPDLVIREQQGDDDDDDNGDDDDDSGGNIHPRVTITYPSNYEDINDTINITGTAQDLDGFVKNVYIQIDTNEWQTVEGINSWNYYWDTTKVVDGKHIITSICFDGQDYSACVSKEVNVKNDGTEPEIKHPDLTGEGSLSWSGIKPKLVISGEFTIENIGSPESELDWEISETPNWGDWTFNPSEGSDLKPEDGIYTIDVVVVTPENKEQNFTGVIRVENKEDKSDFITIPVSLATSKNKEFEIFPFLLRFFEQHQNMFPMIRYILGL